MADPFFVAPTTSRTTPPKTKAGAALYSSAHDDWATPQWLFDALDSEFQFTLDPCCFPDTAKCKKFYTKIDNGLAQSWTNERVFMNPPYGKVITEWVAKAHESCRDEGALVVALVPARTDTKWWHEHVIGAGAEVRFLKGRVKFVRDGATNSAPFPSAIVIYRPGRVV